MTTENSTSKPTVKQKRQRHASAQASYMARKRAEGMEWLATWVPGASKESLKALTKRAGEDERKPSGDYVKSVEAALGEKVPDWAKVNQTLLNIWMISENDLLIDFAGTGEKAESEESSDAPKEKKKKKKKKKKE